VGKFHAGGRRIGRLELHEPFGVVFVFLFRMLFGRRNGAVWIRSARDKETCAGAENGNGGRADQELAVEGHDCCSRAGDAGDRRTRAALEGMMISSG
jgi:hypothetical protein